MIMATRSHLFPFRTQKLSSSTAKVLDHPRSGRIASCRISKKAQSHPMLWLRSFFATCYPTREGEQGILKIADTRYFVLRGEPTTKYSGWRCPSRHAFTLMAARKQVAGFQKSAIAMKVAVASFFCNLLSDKSHFVISTEARSAERRTLGASASRGGFATNR